MSWLIDGASVFLVKHWNFPQRVGVGGWDENKYLGTLSLDYDQTGWKDPHSYADKSLFKKKNDALGLSALISLDSYYPPVLDNSSIQLFS